MAASLGKKRGRSGFTEINVTPLVDVMLVLLVVFMVTAPLLTAGLKVELPNVEAHDTTVKDSKLVVTVTREEKILFGEDDVTADVEGVLAKNARYAAVARVVAAARAAGVEGLNLLVEPEPEAKR